MAPRLESIDGKIRPQVISVAEGNDIIQKNAYVRVFGEVLYRDVFGIQHWTRFCSGHFADGEEANSQQCSKYSTVDNN
jgi:hypothetical protein